MKLRIHVVLYLPSCVYTLMHGFNVTTSSEWWCNVLGTNLCTGYSDLSVPVDLLKLIKVWMNGWFSCVRGSEVVSDWLSFADLESNDRVSVIDWCRNSWWLYCSGDWFCASMFLMGPVWKLDETWPSDYGVMFQEYPFWKFMKRGPWRKREGCSLL